MSKKKKSHVNLHHARTDYARGVMKQIEKDGVCPFCMEHFLKYHTKPILSKGRYWVFTENFDPYAGSKHHLFAVYKTHAVSLDEIPGDAAAELFKGFSKLAKKRKIRGATMFMRYGDTDYTGGTIDHLHAHLVSGTSRQKSKEPLFTWIGYKAGRGKK